MQGEVKRFLEHLRVEKESSQNTVSAYRNDLSQLLDFLESVAQLPAPVDSWQDVQPAVLRNYLRFLERNGYASSTVARKLAAVKSFLSYLQEIGTIGHDPVGDLKPPKVEKTLPRPIPSEAVARLLAEPGKEGTPKGLRDKALLELLYATGMRVSELVNLDVSDVDVRASMVCCGSRKRKRRVPVRKDTVDALENYLAHARRVLAANDEERALFLNHRGRRLTRQGLWLIIREYVEAVGIEEQVTPHILRHTVAAHMLDAGADLEDVQARLGHASSSTTQVYRRICEENGPSVTLDGVRVSENEVEDLPR